MTRTTLLLVALVALVALAGGSGAAAPPPAKNDTLVVAADGSADYESIAAALADADDGDRVAVRPGTYRETLTLRTNVTLVAPRGATLNGSTLDGNPVAITIPYRSDAAPVVDGFTITGYTEAFFTRESSGDWVLRDLVVRDSRDGINALNAYGDWRVERVVVRNVSTGVAAPGSYGDWTVRDVSIRNVNEGVLAADSDGNWTVRRVRIVDAEFTLLDASGAGGDWTARNLTLRDGREGISVRETTGDWRVLDSRVAGIHARESDFGDGSAVYAANTTGAWTLRRAALVNTSAVAVEASGASPPGTVARVFWSGTPGCAGEVRCTEPLDSPPAVATPRGTVADPSPTPTPTSDPGTRTPPATPGDHTPASPSEGTGTTQALSPVLVLVALAVVALGTRR